MTESQYRRKFAGVTAIADTVSQHERTLDLHITMQGKIAIEFAVIEEGVRILKFVGEYETIEEGFLFISTHSEIDTVVYNMLADTLEALSS
jgi:hypothetical protein